MGFDRGLTSFEIFETGKIGGGGDVDCSKVKKLLKGGKSFIWKEFKSYWEMKAHFQLKKKNLQILRSMSTERIIFPFAHFF